MNQTPTPFEARIARIEARRALFASGGGSPTIPPRRPPSLPERRRGTETRPGATGLIRMVWSLLRGR
ncbi:hypothetical protein A3728_19040 [Sulfitobacter sp. HI0040]|uniref:hypothetical protein n=2 Tax=unclassified Sulfitobacter TaxID=196795 RepID=UPI0007C22C55|nr:hypothetical protein [Sulfitobacter sp. HI0040]KZY25457.1 hypothetical protein A3728_19040 [Sulfitobacter sp. HI0040]